MLNGSRSALRSDANQSNKLRIGILSDRDDLANWEAECVRQIHGLACARIDVLILHGREGPSTSAGEWKQVRRGGAAWSIYDRLVLRRKVQAIRRTRFRNCLANVPQVESPWISSADPRQTADELQLDVIREYDLDVVLSFTTGSLPDEIFSLTRHGVWRFHHGDTERFSGTPPAFWEVHDGEPTVRVTLQRLTLDSKTGLILHSGCFKTRETSYPKTLDRILFGSAHFAARALLDLRDDGCFMDRRSSPVNDRTVSRTPGLRDILGMVGVTTRAWLRREYRWLARHQQWTIGIIEQPVTAIFDASRIPGHRASGVRWMPERRGHFFADPMLLHNSTQNPVILAEDFSWKESRGQIAAVEWLEGNYSNAKPAIRREFHLSYPYTVEDRGHTYCVPEAAESSELVLYRLAAGDEWVKDKTILSGFPAVDPTIFKHHDRWWLFCTSGKTGPNEFLYAWSSEELRGDWIPHSANPLKVDVWSARPAGCPFIWSGKLIRPAQDCSERYGGAITFNRVTTLTPTRFDEYPVGKIYPEEGRYGTGLHTICGTPEYTIVDGARTTFIASEFWRALRRARAR